MKKGDGGSRWFYFEAVGLAILMVVAALSALISLISD